jgi:4,5-dihydroxyphthalate decarboxylase
LSKLQLSYVGGVNERVEPLLQGDVEAEGIDIIPTHAHPSEHFWRTLNFWQFEFFEMSISSFLIARDQGSDMVAIPAFPSRMFMHSNIHYHVDSGITGPTDLQGKRIGVGEYQQTSALWTRGILEHDFGVSQFDLEWYMERTEELSHGGATEFTPQAGIKFHRVPKETTLRQMLLNHEIDLGPGGRGGLGVSSGKYTVGAMNWNFVDRATMRPPATGDASKVKPLFPDRMAEGKRFFEAHGFIPANHFFAVRGDVYDKFPWAAFNLYRGLIDAKTIAARDLNENIPSALIFGPEYLDQTRAIVGEDPYPYGMEANRPMLEFMIQMSHEQGFIKTKPKVEDLFKPEFHNV